MYSALAGACKGIIECVNENCQSVKGGITMAKRKGKSEYSSQRMAEIKAIQAELDHRTAVENEAIRLMSELRYAEAEELLKTI